MNLRVVIGGLVAGSSVWAAAWVIVKLAESPEILCFSIIIAILAGLGVLAGVQIAR